MPSAAAPLSLNRSVDFFENLREKAQISGSPVVGILAPGEYSDGVAPLSALIPGDWRGSEVCARLVTSDGLYEARGQYSVPGDWSGGSAEFEFPTGFAQRILEIEPAAMAVLVGRGECLGDATAFALAAWRSELTEGALVFVNSYRADETYLVFPANLIDIDCLPNPSPQRTAFDMICHVPQDLIAGGGSIRIEVNRIRGGGMVPPDLVTLELP